METEWRISSTGYSIKTGWGDDKRIVCSIPAGVAQDGKAFQRWMEDAQRICDLHNATLKETT